MEPNSNIEPNLPPTSGPQDNPTPPTQSGGTGGPSKKMIFIGAAVVVAILAVIGVAAWMMMNKGSNDGGKKQDDGKIHVGNINETKDADIKGVVINGELSQGYKQYTASSADASQYKALGAQMGLDKLVDTGGGTSFASTAQHGGDLVTIFWGRTKDGYTDDAFYAVYNPYQKKVASSFTFDFTKTSPVSVHASNGSTYSIPCQTAKLTKEGYEAHQIYQIYCMGQLKGTNGFIGFTSTASTSPEIEASLKKFVEGTTVQL